MSNIIVRKGRKPVCRFHFSIFFSFKLMKGSGKQALSNPIVVLTKETASGNILVKMILIGKTLN